MGLRKNILCDMEFVMGGVDTDLRKSSAIKIRSYPPEIKKAILAVSPEEGKYYYVLHAVGSYEHWGPTVDGNAFELEELKKGVEHYKKKGKPYLNHWMKKGPIGEILEAAFDDAGKRILLFVKIDEKMLEENTASPGTKAILLQKLRNGERIAVSNGVDPDMDVCSICGNTRRSYKDSACYHIKHMVGQIMEDGKIVSMLNKGLKFDDISFLTLNPADRSAYTLKKVASEGDTIAANKDSEEELTSPEDRFNAQKQVATHKVLQLGKRLKEALKLHLEYLLDLEAYMGYPSDYIYFLKSGVSRNDGRDSTSPTTSNFMSKHNGKLSEKLIVVLTKLKVFSNIGAYFKFKFKKDTQPYSANPELYPPLVGRLELLPNVIEDLTKQYNPSTRSKVAAFLEAITKFPMKTVSDEEFLRIWGSDYNPLPNLNIKNSEWDFDTAWESFRLVENLTSLMDEIYTTIYVHSIVEENSEGDIDYKYGSPRVLVSDLPEETLAKIKNAEAKGNHVYNDYLDIDNRILFVKKLKNLYNTLK